MKVAIVSGNVKGIGKNITLSLLEEGYFVPIHYRKSEDEALIFRQEVKNKYNIELDLFKADLNNYEEALRFIEYVKKRYGKVEVLVNNVGDYLYKNLLEVSFEEWKYIIDSNLNSAFLLTNNLVSCISKRIIFIGFAGVSSLKSSPFTTAYTIAKIGIIVYAKSLAKLLAEKGITVNVVSIGVAENSITKPLNEIPMKRTASLDEISYVVKFLINDKSDYITGQVIEVSGGWRI